MHLANRRRTKSLLCILLLATVAACASPARTSFMIPETHQAVVSHEASPVYRAIALTDVGGGKKTNPMWTSEVRSEEFGEALRRALEAHDYLSLNPANAPYQLRAFIIEVRHPAAGFTLTVNSSVRYTLSRMADGDVLFDDVIQGAHTATIDDAFYGVTRLRLAEEGAMRASISTLLERLQSL